MSATYITTLMERPAHGVQHALRVAVKDVIDVVGVQTTAGSRLIASEAVPAADDALCLAGFRRAQVDIVGKTNLHELAVFATGINPWFGTPKNPLDPALIPGGSSSGSAVAVADGTADVALGTDTGGSIRVPAACCGVCGLKTTYGRVPLDGVYPLAPSLDTVGVLAMTVSGLEVGMSLLDATFQSRNAEVLKIGRVRTAADPRIEASVDDALKIFGVEILEVELPEWSGSSDLFSIIFYSEVWKSHHRLIERDSASLLGADVRRAIKSGAGYLPDLDVAYREAQTWTKRVLAMFEQVDCLALPTLPIYPPSIEDVIGNSAAYIDCLTRYTLPFNLSGLPALSLPVYGSGALPASIQFVGPPDAEALLLATARTLENKLDSSVTPKDSTTAWG